MASNGSKPKPLRRPARHRPLLGRASAPPVAKYLADHGAEVIRVESATRMETLRGAGPFTNNFPHYDNSGYYANFNSSKFGVTINLKHERGKELLKRLVAVSDVVTESFTPGSLKEARARLRGAAQGAPRPRYDLDAPLRPDRPLGALHGLRPRPPRPLPASTHLTGWPDGEPIGTGVAYTDFLVPHMGAIALVAALDYRRRTGKGQYIDFSQFEGAIHALGPSILEWTAKRPRGGAPRQPRPGGRAPRRLPLQGRPLRRHRLLHRAGVGGLPRRHRPARLDRPRAHAPQVVASRRAEGDRPAHRVLVRRADRRAGLQGDARARRPLRHRQVARGDAPRPAAQAPRPLRRPRSPHDGGSARTYDSPAFRLSKTPGGPWKAAPLLGEDTERVLKATLNLSDEEFTELLVEGALE